MNKDRIRKILLDNGFTIKEGQADLKPYVYKAAAALFEEASYVPVHLPSGSHVNGPAWEDGFETGSADLRMAIKSAADALENAAKELELESPVSSAFSTYCQEFDAKALKLAKYRYQKLTPEQLEMIITLRTAPFVATALSDFKRQPCDETESILIHDIVQAYWERISK